RNAINSAANGDSINFFSNITLTSNLPTVRGSVTINGHNRVLSGNGLYRGLFVEKGNVTISDLKIENARAQGGRGGNANGGGGGGGGAGLGGALFIAAGANVMLINNVEVRNN